MYIPHLAVCLHLFRKCTFTSKTHWKQLPLAAVSHFVTCWLIPLSGDISSLWVSGSSIYIADRTPSTSHSDWKDILYELWWLMLKSPSKHFLTVTFNAGEAACGLAFTSQVSGEWAFGGKGMTPSCPDSHSTTGYHEATVGTAHPNTGRALSDSSSNDWWLLTLGEKNRPQRQEEGNHTVNTTLRGQDAFWALRLRKLLQSRLKKLLVAAAGWLPTAVSTPSHAQSSQEDKYLWRGSVGMV